MNIILKQIHNNCRVPHLIFYFLDLHIASYASSKLGGMGGSSQKWVSRSVLSQMCLYAQIFLPLTMHTKHSQILGFFFFSSSPPPPPPKFIFYA